MNTVYLAYQSQQRTEVYLHLRSQKYAVFVSIHCPIGVLTGSLAAHAGEARSRSDRQGKFALRRFPTSSIPDAEPSAAETLSEGASDRAAFYAGFIISGEEPPSIPSKDISLRRSLCGDVPVTALKVVYIRYRLNSGNEPFGMRRKALCCGQLFALFAWVGVAALARPLASQQAAPPAPAQIAGLSETPQPLPASLVQLPPAPGSIHGTVVNREGAVYEGARVELVQAGVAQSASLAPARVSSDSNGNFSFAGVPPGPFRLNISSNGFASQVISGTLSPGESYEAQPVVLLVNAAASEVRVTASQVEIAQEQVKEEEIQRVLGVIPNFYVSYVPDAAPLTARQKFSLAWMSSIDPVAFLASGAFAGVEQAANSFSGYGQGAQGYGKRFGANYADGFVGGMLGNAVFPALLKQDPRYFYKGTGTIRSRALYAIANSVICKGDNGHWQANYSGILGSLAAGGVSNLYYPAADRDGVSLTVENTLLSIGGSAVANLFQEFVVRKLTPRLPNYGSPKP